MSKTITLRLSDENYKVYKKLADRDNRPISNFIETAVKRFIELTPILTNMKWKR